MAVGPDTVAPPASLSRIAGRVETLLTGLLDAETDRWTAVDPDLAAPLRSLRALVLAGGKRLRPAFCHWGHVAAGGDPDNEAVASAGAALELLHTFALVHDDVMDNSPKRRGMDAVHVEFTALHQAGGWRGEGRRFGEGAAILVGDIAFVYADLLLHGAPGAAIDVFTEMRLEVNVGQYLDLVNTVRPGATVESARRICQYKSGKYTVERPLHLGAALAGGLDRLGPTLTAYGMPLGEAFQLRDDLLGAFGDSDVLGKGVGEDLREAKPTALVALAREMADDAGRDLIDRRLGAPDLTDDEIADLQAVLDSSGARARVQADVNRLVAESVAALDGADLAGDAGRHLTDLAWFVAGRDH